jgi:hypothetical protein
MPDKPIFRNDVAGPAVHALAIGVGHYPHLKGGGKSQLAQTEGMGQLTSAPASARAFAAWLLAPDGFQHPEGRPLASVRLLLSEKNAKPFTHPQTGQTSQPPPATVNEVNDAINGWVADLDKDVDNVGLFFFSGHGVTAGLKQALLLSDFGENANNAYDPAIRFEDFHLGLSRVKARAQAFFIDACRSHSESFADTFGAGGRPFVLPSQQIKHARPRAAPVFNASLLGEQAFGLKNKPSFFTQALLDALRGAGGDNADAEAEWNVEALMLSSGIEFLQAQAAKRAKLARAPVNPINHGERMLLHRLRAPPVVPVTAACQPAVDVVEFAWDAPRWKLNGVEPFVPVGLQTFTAKARGNPARVGSVQRTVRPPFVRVTIPLVEGE